MPDSLADIAKRQNISAATQFLGTRPNVRPLLPVGPQDVHLSVGEWRDFGTMFARESLPVEIGMTIWEQSHRRQFAPAADYDPFEVEDLNGYEDFAALLGTARSPEEFKYRKTLADDQRRKLEKARKTILGNVGGFVGGLANVSSLVPIGGVAGKATVSMGAIRSGLRTARNLGLITAAEQTALMALDGTRSDREVLSTVGMAYMIGGAIGTFHSLTFKGSEAMRRFSPEIDAQDRLFAKDVKTPSFDAATYTFPKGAGGASGAAPVAKEALLKSNRPAAAAWLDRIPDNPIKRLLQSSSVAAQRAVARMADIGFYQAKNLDEAGNIPTAPSAWTNYKITWVPAAVAAKKETEKLFVAFRRRMASESKNGRPVSDSVMKIRARDALDRITQKAVGTSFEDFLTMVGRAKAGATDVPQEAIAAAKAWDEHVYKPLAEHGRSSGVFKEDVYRPDYLNRIYLVGKIGRDREGFMQILMRHGYSRDVAKEITDNIISGRPLVNRKAGSGEAASIHERELGDVPDAALEPFLERNIYVAGDKYARTVGVDSELAKSLGNANFEEILDEIRKGFDQDYAAAKNVADKAKILGDRHAVERDLAALRDLLRGTYGIPKDPTRLTSRAIRFAKNFNAMTQLTGGLVALTDVGTLVLQEGLTKTFNSGFRSLFKNLDSFKLAKKEAELAGEAIELYSAMRAGGIADLAEDIGDVSRLEHWVQRATNAAFVFNGLNVATDAVKAMASMVIGTRILEDVTKVAMSSQAADIANAAAAGQIRVDGAALARSGGADLAKLARAGINRDLAIRIAKEAEKHGEKFDHTWIANTDKWTDKAAVKAYRAALSKDINFAVITPQPGEKPLWMSRELGSMLGQYRGYSVAAMQRVAMTSLQRPEMQLLGGVAALVGMGALIDHIRSGQNNAGERGFGTKLKGAIDRSGILAYIGDINNVFETLNDNRFGLGAALGADGHPTSTIQKMGALFGPSVNTWGNVYRVMNDATFGNWSDASAKAARRLLYLQNTAHFDWLFDAAQKGMGPDGARNDLR
jgi:hypothetical protein